MFDTSQHGQRERGETEQYPKHKQNDAKHRKGVDTKQAVTDPVTHSSVTKHDFTAQELKHTLENIPPTGGRQLPMSDVGGRPESKIQLDKGPKCKEPHAGNERLFPPIHEDAKAELVKTCQFSFNVGMGAVHLFMALALFGQLFDVGTKLWSSGEIDRKPRVYAALATITFQALLFGFGVWGSRRWVENIVDHFWEHLYAAFLYEPIPMVPFQIIGDCCVGESIT